MAFGSRNYRADPAAEAVPVEDESLSSAREAVPVPYLAGTRKIALRWISPIYNQRAEEAPVERPAKK